MFVCLSLYQKKYKPIGKSKLLKNQGRFRDPYVIKKVSHIKICNTIILFSELTQATNHLYVCTVHEALHRNTI